MGWVDLVVAGSGLNKTVAALTPYKDGLIVGGYFTMAGNKVSAFLAEWIKGSHTIFASAGPNGTIAPSGDILVPFDSSQTFSITPNGCYHIADVLVDSSSVGAVSSYLFNNVTASHTIRATFAQDVLTVTASAGTYGTIAPSGTLLVNCGSDQSFNMIPDQWYHVKDVLVDGSSVGAVTNYTMSNVTANRTISATFTCCVGKRGNINCTGIIDLTDLSALVSYLTGGGLVLCCPDAANVNGTGIVDLADLSALVSYLTGGGYVLPNCP